MNTATLREPQPIHEVKFHGVDLSISIDMDVFWLAADKNGEVWCYEYEPTPVGVSFAESSGLPFKIADVDLNGINWRDTAKEYRV